MSYILDALRKAEHQRQQGQPQTIYTPPSPLEQGHRGLRGIPWLPLLAGLLLLNALLLGLWWRFAQAPPAVEELPPPAEAQLIAPSPAPVIGELPEPRPLPVDPEVERPPLLGDLPPSVKQRLPTLGIQAHIHVQGDPKKSVIMLNTEMLREGERGTSGVEVVRIGSEEVLLRYRKTEFRMKVRR